MNIYTIALFGEAEKGEYHYPYILTSLPELVDSFGNPPPNSQGLFFAVQALMYHRQLIFFRVQEEGFSLPDYFHGLKILEGRHQIPSPNAICTPGVGDSGVIEALTDICQMHSSILITTAHDFYDYLTDAA